MLLNVSVIVFNFSFGTQAYSRAYINFKNYEDVFDFRNKFDGYIFFDSRGMNRGILYIFRKRNNDAIYFKISLIPCFILFSHST